jgi:hypothetical protein
MLFADKSAYNAQPVYSTRETPIYGPLSFITSKDFASAHEFSHKVDQIRADFDRQGRFPRNASSAVVQGLIDLNVKLEQALRELIKRKILLQSELDAALDNNT